MADLTYPAALVETFARRVIAAMGAVPTVAATVAGHLVGANLAGHDSHGVLRIPQYVREADAGTLLPGVEPVLLRQRGALGIVEAGRGFGHSATALAMEWAAARTAEHGIAACAVRHANHLGRLGEYAEIAAARGVVGITTVGVVGAGLVAPFGGVGRFLGTNPWSIGIPASGPPMILDFATSAVAEGKVRVALAKGVRLPEGALVDAAGAASTNPADLYAGGALLPLGGALAGHKGYALSLAAALVGALAMIDDEAPTAAGTTSQIPAGPWLAGALVIAIDPEWFGGADRYRTAVERSLEALRAQPARAGGEILVPGDPERRSRARRSVEGIPIPAATVAELDEVARRYGAGVAFG